MKNFFRIMACALACMLVTSCIMDYEINPTEPYAPQACIENHSDHPIVVCEASHTRMQPTVYPDTLLPKYLFIYYEDDKYYEDSKVVEYFGTPSDTTDHYALMPPGDWQYALLSPHKFSWETFCEQFPAGYYSVFFIDGETVFEKSWADIRKDNDYIVRYDLTYYDLLELDLTIPFPPTEDMRDMKMWPPYEEVMSRYK